MAKWGAPPAQDLLVWCFDQVVARLDPPRFATIFRPHQNPQPLAICAHSASSKACSRAGVRRSRYRFLASRGAYQTGALLDTWTSPWGGYDIGVPRRRCSLVRCVFSPGADHGMQVWPMVRLRLRPAFHDHMWSWVPSERFLVVMGPDWRQRHSERRPQSARHQCGG